MSTILSVVFPQAAHQSAAVLGLALVAMTEDLGRDMAYRSLEHLLQYGEPAVRCAPARRPPPTAAFRHAQIRVPAWQRNIAWLRLSRSCGYRGVRKGAKSWVIHVCVSPLTVQRSQSISMRRRRSFQMF